MTDILHVHPLHDAVEHDTSTSEPDCVCVPKVRPEKRDDGSMGWLIVHHSLDGRETREARAHRPGRRIARWRWRIRRVTRRLRRTLHA